MITVRSTINLAHQSVPEVIPVVQGDTGRSILFTLADFTIPAGATARYFVMKPSGLAVYNDATIDGNTVLVNLTAQSIAEAGDSEGQVRISVGDDIVTSFDFILHVEPFRGIDAVESTNETNIFDQAIEEAEEYISQAIDPTLTIANKAADAKATGDAIWSIFPTESAQGNPATFDDGADEIPVKDLKVSIVPNQDLHGYDKPWAGGAGKNKYPVLIGEDTFTSNASGTYSNTDGVLNVSMTSANNSGVYAPSTSELGKMLSSLTAQENYTYSFDIKASTAGTIYVGYEVYGAKGVSVTTDWSRTSISFTKGSNNSNFAIYNKTGSQNTVQLRNFQLESGSTASAWQPYSNICPITGTEEVWVEVADDEETKAEYTIPLGRTVYGGTLDVTTGVLTVDEALATITQGMINRNSGTSWWLNVVGGGYPAAKVTGVAYTDGVYSDKFAPGITAAQNVVHVNAYGTPRINTSKDYASAADMYADIGEFTVAYPLATPQTYQLTPQELLSVLGTNHISTDAESADVEYRADIKLYIEQLTEPDADMIADTNITSGSYFMVGNTLYLATANIANGAAVVVGTNCVRSNLAEALNALNA